MMVDNRYRICGTGFSVEGRIGWGVTNNIFDQISRFPKSVECTRKFPSSEKDVKERGTDRL